MNTAIISIGTNIEPRANADHALDILRTEQELVKVSPLVITKPIGYTDQPDFINCGALIRTTKLRDSFVNYLKDIELRLGRSHTGNKYDPRTIDLDLIVWNGEIVNNDYYEREFIRTAVTQLLSG